MTNVGDPEQIQRCPECESEDVGREEVYSETKYLHILEDLRDLDPGSRHDHAIYEEVTSYSYDAIALTCGDCGNSSYEDNDDWTVNGQYTCPDCGDGYGTPHEAWSCHQGCSFDPHHIEDDLCLTDLIHHSGQQLQHYDTNSYRFSCWCHDNCGEVICANCHQTVRGPNHLCPGGIWDGIRRAHQMGPLDYESYIDEIRAYHADLAERIEDGITIDRLSQTTEARLTFSTSTDLGTIDLSALMRTTAENLWRGEPDPVAVLTCETCQTGCCSNHHTHHTPHSAWCAQYKE